MHEVAKARFLRKEEQKAENELKRTIESMKGVYATSTKSPEKANKISYIFEEDGSKYWSTMAGLGPDEGFMLYFNKETYIGEFLLEISNKRGSAGK